MITDQLKQMFAGLQLDEWDPVTLDMDKRLELYYLFVSTVRHLQDEYSDLLLKHAKLKVNIRNLANE
jgi:hypothetical protein